MVKPIFLVCNFLFALFATPFFAQNNSLEKDKLAVDTLFFSDQKLALTISEKNIPIALQAKDTFHITYFLDQAGELNRMAGNYDKGIEQMQKCLLYKVNWEDLKDLSLTYNNLGKAYIRKGQYELAIYHFIEALKLMETDQNLMGQGFYLNNIAAVYDLQHNYEKALEYYMQSLVIKKEIGDETGIAASYTNLGITYLNLGNYELSFKYNEDAYKIYKKHDKPSKTARTLNNMGEVKMKMEQINEAMSFLQKAYALDSINEDDFLRTNILQNLSKIHLQNNILDSALFYITKAENRASASQSYKSLKDIYVIKSAIEKKKGNFELSLNYLTASTEYNDSLINESNIQAISEITGKYEYEKHLRAISDGELLIAQKEKTIEQEKIKVVYWVGISIFLIVAAIVLFVLYFLKQKNTQLLKGQMVLIDSRNKYLNSLNQKIKTELDRTQISLEEKEELINNVFVKSKSTELPPELLALSKRETEVLSYLALGWSDDQLAEKLFVSKSTVKTHLRRIYSKLLVRGRAEAVAIAHKYDLVGNVSEEE